MAFYFFKRSRSTAQKKSELGIEREGVARQGVSRRPGLGAIVRSHELLRPEFPRFRVAELPSLSSPK